MMDRTRLAHTLLAPLDGSLGLLVDGLARTGTLEATSKAAMGGLGAALRC